MKIKTLSVTELNNYISKIINSNPLLHNFSVSGEVFNLKQTQYGYIFFSLKDENSKINCIYFSENKVSISDGDKLVVEGKLNIYEKNGTYSIIVKKFNSIGLGDSYLEFEKIKKALEEKGYFDKSNKKPLPKHPQKIGIVTSISGAAIKDIIKLAQKRYPVIEIVIYNAKMQGQEAVINIVEGINVLNNIEDIELIILTRGGGSYDELSIFNNEMIAKSIFESKKPIISAIGHEIDFVISDFVADARASTPSSAIENFLPDINHIETYIMQLKEKIDYSLNRKLEFHKINLGNIVSILEKSNFSYKLANNRKDLFNMKIRLDYSIYKLINKEKNSIEKFGDKLSSLNPIEIINKGYAIIDKDKAIITTINQISADDIVNIKLSDGIATAKIISVRNEDRKNEKK